MNLKLFRSRAAWLKQVYDICIPKRQDTPSSVEGLRRWQQIFRMPVYRANFDIPETTTIKYRETETFESFMSLLLTWSGIAILPDDEKDDLRKQIKTVLERGEELVWVDEKQGIFEVPRESPIVIFRRI